MTSVSSPEMRPAVVSVIVTGHAPVSYWPILFLVPSNNPRSLCESELVPVSLSILKMRIGWSGCREENGAQLFFSSYQRNRKLRRLHENPVWVNLRPNRPA